MLIKYHLTPEGLNEINRIIISVKIIYDLLSPIALAFWIMVTAIGLVMV